MAVHDSARPLVTKDDIRKVPLLICFLLFHRRMDCFVSLNLGYVIFSR